MYVAVVSPYSRNRDITHNTTITRLYCTICKRTGHTDRFRHHSRSCNHGKKMDHTLRECFNLHSELLVQAQQRRKKQGVPPLCTSSKGPRAMSVVTIQLSPSDPIDIQHRLFHIDLQLQCQSALAGSSTLAFSAASCIFSPWILDSGASYHMISNSTILSAITHFHHTSYHCIQPSSQLATTQTWSIISLTLTLSLALRILHLCMNFISIGCLREIGLIITFDYFTCSVQDPQSGQTISCAHRGETIPYWFSLCPYQLYLVFLVQFSIYNTDI